MRSLHIANVNFEWELKEKLLLLPQQSFATHPYFLQLQFLPLLYAKSTDGVAVTHLPPSAYLTSLEKIRSPLPTLHLFGEPLERHYEKIESWGWSQSVKRWADTQKLFYHPPPFPLIYEMASKLFPFTHSSPLPGATTLHTMEEIKTWLSSGDFPKVIKICYSLSGQGTFHFSSFSSFFKVEKKLAKALQERHPLIGEPWVNRIFDFSTQWLLEKGKEAECTGITQLENSPKGSYKGTRVDEKEKIFGSYLPFYEEHIEKIKPLLHQMREKGYYGNLGIDAMLYRHPLNENKICLHSIVEINLRKTMGWVAIQLSKVLTKGFLQLSYTSSQEEGLLPPFLTINERKKIFFQKQLNLCYKRN